MSISYPLSLPTSIGIESIELRAVNAVATSQSPFTYKQQIVAHQGQRWEASINIPPVRRDLAAPWKAFLTSLKGPTGTFLLGDPDYATPQGIAATFPGTPIITSQSGEAISVTGASANKTNWLIAGDYIQIGSGINATLHQVLQNASTDNSGNVTLEIWPKLRSTRSGSVIVSNAKGLFRLATNVSSWSINNSSAYGISFEAVEAIV